MTTSLKGMTCSHPRGYHPTVAISLGTAVQKSTYSGTADQPGHTTTWVDEAINALFRDTF